MKIFFRNDLFRVQKSDPPGPCGKERASPQTQQSENSGLWTLLRGENPFVKMFRAWPQLQEEDGDDDAQFPVLWTAPEIVNRRRGGRREKKKFSHKSDVWSFGKLHNS